MSIERYSTALAKFITSNRPKSRMLTMDETKLLIGGGRTSLRLWDKNFSLDPHHQASEAEDFFIYWETMISIEEQTVKFIPHIDAKDKDELSHVIHEAMNEMSGKLASALKVEELTFSFPERCLIDPLDKTKAIFESDRLEAIKKLQEAKAKKVKSK